MTRLPSVLPALCYQKDSLTAEKRQAVEKVLEDIKKARLQRHVTRVDIKQLKVC